MQIRNPGESRGREGREEEIMCYTVNRAGGERKRPLSIKGEGTERKGKKRRERRWDGILLTRKQR